MKKSDILLQLARELSFGRFLDGHPEIPPESLSALLKEAAAAVGPGELAVAETAPKPKPAHAGKPGGRLRMFTDGASRGNPGQAGIGVFIEDGAGRNIKKIARYLGLATNNQAEYTALTDGLRAAAELGAEELEILADSELMVKQMNGLYKVKNPDLQSKHAEAKSLLKPFKRVVIKYIPREKNKEADALANKAIDQKIR